MGRVTITAFHSSILSLRVIYELPTAFPCIACFFPNQLAECFSDFKIMLETLVSNFTLSIWEQKLRRTTLGDGGGACRRLPWKELTRRHAAAAGPGSQGSTTPACVKEKSLCLGPARKKKKSPPCYSPGVSDGIAVIATIL